MSVANNFCDKPLPKYLDSKTVLIYRPHPVYYLKPVFWILIRIQIHRIHMFLGLPDRDPDPLVRGIDPDQNPAPDPSIIKQKSKKNFDSYCFGTSFGLYIFEK